MRKLLPKVSVLLSLSFSSSVPLVSSGRPSHTGASSVVVIRHVSWCPDTTPLQWEIVLKAWLPGARLWQGAVAVQPSLRLRSPYGEYSERTGRNRGRERKRAGRSSLKDQTLKSLPRETKGGWGDTLALL